MRGSATSQAELNDLVAETPVPETLEVVGSYRLFTWAGEGRSRRRAAWSRTGSEMPLSSIGPIEVNTRPPRPGPIAAGLVDELRLFVSPVVVGGGTRAHPDGVRWDLDLVNERRFGNGVVHLRYRTVASRGRGRGGPRPRCFRYVSGQTSSGTATGATGATSREVIGERLNPLTTR